MQPNDIFSITLAGLLEDASLGVERLNPRPGGGNVTGEVFSELERALEALEDVQIGPYPLVYGNGCFAVGRYDDASDVYVNILDREPGNLAARFNLGLTYLRLRMGQKAVDELSTAILQDPTLAEAYYQRGNAFDELGAGELALEDYSRALALKPDYLQAIYNRGVALSELGRHQEAVDAFTQTIRLRPTLSNAYLNQGASPG